VPAFAATETFERFRKKFSNFKYKEAVLDPTNPRDLADEQERAIIGKFLADTSLQETSGELFRGFDRFYYVARPIQIKNPACLACHDTPDRAPATMRQIYGDKGGFGWKHNQIVGAQIIVVPAYEQDATVKHMLTMVAGLFAATFAVMLVVVNLLLSRRED
jgi:protein-histidine pros-kinase